VATTGETAFLLALLMAFIFSLLRKEFFGYY
jgi:hypothetical protein